VTPATVLRSRGRGHARSTVAPRGPRRISGPVAAPAGAAALPRLGTTSVFGRIRALPEHRVVDRLLRSRLWIWALGALLMGIVTMQVSLLKLNAGISRAVQTTTTLERQNAGLEASIARLSAPDRIESGAASLGMVMPAAGDVSYVTARARDAASAVSRMEPPSEGAAALMANAGIVPGSLGEPAALAAASSPTVPESAAVDPAVAPVTTPASAAAPPTTTTHVPAPSGAVAGQG
jgi:cell division protein FtsL